MPKALYKPELSNIAQQCLTDFRGDGIPVSRGQPRGAVNQLGHVLDLVAETLQFPDKAAMAKAFEVGFVPPASGWDQQAAVKVARKGFDLRAVRICQKHFKGGMPPQITYALKSEGSIPFSGTWPDYEVIRSQAYRVAPLLLEESEVCDNQPELGHCTIFAMDDVDTDSDVEKDGVRRLSAVVMAQFYESLPDGTADQLKPFVGFHLKLEFELGRVEGQGRAEYINPRGYSVWGGVLIDPSKANG